MKLNVEHQLTYRSYGMKQMTHWTIGTQTLETGSILPAADETYDLGSESLKFRDLFLSGSTIKLGGATLSASGESIPPRWYR